MSRAARLFTLLLSAAAAACHHDAPTIPLEDVPERMGEAVCKKVLECCREEDLRYINNLGTSDATCREWIEGRWTMVATWRRRIQHGNTEYRPEIFAACMAALEKQPCAEFGGLYHDGWAQTRIPECAIERWLAGKFPLGQKCEFNWECMSELCSTRGISFQGVCVAEVPPDGDCRKWGCSREQRCNGDDGRCVSLKPEGAECQNAAECASQRCGEHACQSPAPWCTGR